MRKKRLIFTLLYDSGSFVLSKNFRLQKVGDINWLQKNYNFKQIAFFIDELIVLDVSRSERNLDNFCDVLKKISTGCFVPIAAGGGVTSSADAKQLLRSGADKVVLNTCLFEDLETVRAINREFGQQCLVGSLDAKQTASGDYEFITNNGQETVGTGLQECIFLKDDLVGEIYLNSVDRDGTGQGFDLKMLDMLPTHVEVPVILAGGVGNAKHFSEGFDDERVSAVATANLFNFIGDGLNLARGTLYEEGKQLAVWPSGMQS